jgi:hypothetical protein
VAADKHGGPRGIGRTGTARRTASFTVDRIVDPSDKFGPDLGAGQRRSDDALAGCLLAATAQMPMEPLIANPAIKGFSFIE